MNIGILDEFREKQMTGINRVVAGTMTELLKIDNANKYSFIGKTDYLPVKLDEIGIFFDKSKEINLNYTLYSHKLDIVHSFYRAYDFSKHIDCARIFTILLVHPEAGSKDLYNYFHGPVRNCAKNADFIISDSEFTKKEIIEHYGIEEEKIKVIYPGLYPKHKFTSLNVTSDITRLADEEYILSVS